MNDRRRGLVVCRGCCCGTDKHPDTDHAAHLARLGQLARRSGGDVRLTVSTCLDMCARSNVVVVQPSRAGRRRGGKQVWLGDLLADDAVEAVESWLADGGPGLSDLPARLAAHVVRPSREARGALSEG